MRGIQVLPAVALAAAVVAVAACAADPRPAEDGTLRVVTTVAPVTSIVANVAGDFAEITGLVPEGTNSHTFEPKPSAAAALANADVVFVNGLRLEDPTLELARDNLAAGSEVVALGDRTLSPGEYLYDFSFPRDGGKPNPHVWTNPPMAARYAELVADVLAAHAPRHATAFEANKNAFIARIGALDDAMRAASATVPPAQRALLTYHDAFAYFAQEYGWTVIGAIQVSDFDEPTPREVAALVEQIRTEGVPAIFGSEVFPSPVLAQLGRETGVRYVDVLRDDDLPGEPGDTDHSWLGLMRFDYVTMVEALGGDASALHALDVDDVAVDLARYP